MHAGAWQLLVVCAMRNCQHVLSFLVSWPLLLPLLLPAPSSPSPRSPRPSPSPRPPRPPRPSPFCLKSFPFLPRPPLSARSTRSSPSSRLSPRVLLPLSPRPPVSLPRSCRGTRSCQSGCRRFGWHERGIQGEKVASPDLRRFH